MSKTSNKHPFDLSTLDIKHLRRIIDLMNDTKLSEFEIEREGIRLRLRRGGEAPTVSMTSTDVSSSVSQQPAAKQEQPALTAPLVGTFYQAASPDAAPFVNVGDKIKKGQVVGIIEAMKTMNQVEADKAGTVVQILVENGQPVEFGQPLMTLE